MIALRQSYIANAKTISSIVVQAGDLVVVGLYQDGAQVATSCADSAGNTYSKAAEQHITDGAGCGVYLYYTVAGSTGSITITGTMAGSGYDSIFVHVYSGTFDLASTLHAFQTKGETVRSTSHTSAEVTTTTPDALLFCLWGEPSGSGTISENGAGFTERQEDAGTATYDRIVSSAGTYADAVTSTVSAAFASILAAFREVPSSTGPWRGVFPGTWSVSEAALSSFLPGALVALAMLGTPEPAGFNGTGSSIQALQSGGGTGTVTLAGTGASSQRVQACTGTGTQAVSGTGASTQRTQTGAGTGAATQAGTGASSQRVQSGGGSGSVTLTGSGGSIQRLQTCAGTGTNITGATGSGASMQALQSGSGVGTVTLSGSGASVQRVQTSTGAGSMTFTGTGAVSQAIQGGSGAGTLALSGAGASVQAFQSGGGTGENIPLQEPLTTDPRYLLTVTRRTFALAVPARSFTLQAAYRSFSIAKPTPDRSIVLPARSFEVTL